MRASLASAELSRPGELLVLGLHSRLELADRRLLEQPLARLQGAGGFGGQCLRGGGRGRKQIAVGYHAGHEAEFGCPRRR